MKILIKFASRSRPLKIIECLKNIRETIEDKENYHIILSLDYDDEMSLKYVYQFMGEDVEVRFGKSKGKINAINRDIPNDSNYDIVICMSDDMKFIVNGWDNKVRDLFNANKDKHVLHLGDGNRDDLITMSITTWEEYKKNGHKIYYPEYKSVYCDNDQTDKAKLEGTYFYNSQVLFNHLHPGYGRGEMDDQYLRTESRELYDHDLQVYERRKANGFKD
jgi:hypothetical protein